MFPFASELYPPSPQNIQADVLVEYQRLIKHYGYCKKRTFQDCLRLKAKEIPLNERCQIPDSACNAYEK